MTLSLSVWLWLLALTPVLCVVVLMLAFQWGGRRAGGVGWLVAILVAVLFFGAGFRLLAVAQVKAVLLSLDVLLIIWNALLLFNISKEAGAIRFIGQALPGLTDDRVMQSLLIGWLMASFLQGLGGFGVPVAVTAPILVGLGFGPVQAVAMASIGHGWGVNYGSLASSYQSLLAVTGLPGEYLAPLSSVLLGIACFPSGLLVALIGTGWKGMKRAFLPVLLLSAVMGFVQYLLATNGLWTLGTTGGAIAGLLVMFLLLKLPPYRSKQLGDSDVLQKRIHVEKPAWFSLLAYALLVVLAFAVNLIRPLNAFLGKVVLNLDFPAVQTAYGWLTPAGPGREISLFNHPGAILLITCAVAYLVFRMIGFIQGDALPRILKNTFKSGVSSSLGILSMVGVATVMMHSGMTTLLAQGLSVSVGRDLFPVVSPFIGALGAFITGSNNNSNVLFAVLQQNTAELLNLSVPLILAAQTTGGSIGSVLAPAKVIVGSSTVGLAGKEGIVMRKLLSYGLIAIGVVAIATLILHLVQ